jgi:hypothetical protein
MRLMHSGLAAQQRRRDLGKGRCHFLRAGPPAATQYDTGAHLGMARACHLISEVITLILGEFKSVLAIMERLRGSESYLSNDVVRPISLDKSELGRKLSVVSILSDIFIVEAHRIALPHLSPTYRHASATSLSLSFFGYTRRVLQKQRNAF